MCVSSMITAIITITIIIMIIMIIIIIIIIPLLFCKRIRFPKSYLQIL